MNEQRHMTLLLSLDNADFSPLVPLFQKGVHVKTEVGRSVRHLLCGQYHVDPEYLAERIQTIFLDGKVVDSVDTTTVKDGAIMAVSAAMPGLAGATLRKGGLLAGTRNGISHKEETLPADGGKAAWVKIKLFNLLIREMGPLFLREGIWVAKEDVEDLIRRCRDLHRRIFPEESVGSDAPIEPGYVFLRGMTTE